MDNLVIRNIRLEDADEISRIQASITKLQVELDFNKVIEEQIEGQEDVTLVAEIDGKIAGYMIGYIVHGGFGLEKSAWIASLGVDPKYMGQGIGQGLAEEIFKVYREKGIRHAFTSVRWDSVDLLSFFKTLGFDRSHFINLRKDLDP